MVPNSKALYSPRACNTRKCCQKSNHFWRPFEANADETLHEGQTSNDKKAHSKSMAHVSYDTLRRMAENGFAPPPREFCRHILSCRELKAKSFKRCLHSVLRGVSL